MSIQLKARIKLLPLFCISAEKLVTLSEFFCVAQIMNVWIICEKAQCLLKNTFDLAITTYQMMIYFLLCKVKNSEHNLSGSVNLLEWIWTERD